METTRGKVMAPPTAKILVVVAFLIAAVLLGLAVTFATSAMADLGRRAAGSGVFVGVLSWWPGGDSRWSTAPEYDHRVTVVDTIRRPRGWRDRRDEALREWNRCGADLRLALGGRAEPFSAGTITLYRDPEGPYGWWSEERGGYAAFGGFNGVADIAHELGHALGFGHGGNAVMKASSSHVRVSDVECEGLRMYYGRGA